MTERDVSKAVGRYRRLLSLYPKDFRARFANSMCAAFSAEVQATRGRRAYCWLWCVTVAQAIPHALAERLAERRQGTHTCPHHPHETSFGLGSARDVRVAMRALARRPGYTALIITTLTLGIGANASIFTVVNAYLFAPLPFEESDRLVHIRDVVSRPGEVGWWYTPTPRSFHAIREGFPRFTRIAAQTYRTVSVRTDADAVQVAGVAVSDGWLETLGTEPVLGRGFSAAEQSLGSAARSVMISHELWNGLLGGDPDAVGRTLVLDGEPFTLVGVLPEGFHYPWAARLWLMGDFDPNSGGFGAATVARLAPDQDLEPVRTALAEFSNAVAAAHPDTHADIRFDLVTMREQLFGNRPDVSLVLLGAVLLLLLTASASVAGVSVARTVARDRELAVRSSLGAGRLRLARLVFIEGAVLATVGGGLALLTTGWTARRLTDLVASSESGLAQVTASLQPDGRVVSFTVGATLLVTLLTACVPALLATRSRTTVISDDAMRAGLSRSARRALRTVVVAEVAFAVPLLLAAALVHQSYIRLSSVERGYEAAGRFAVRLALPTRRFADASAKVRGLAGVVERLEAEPGVIAAGYTHHLPVTPGDWTRAYSIDGVMMSEPGRSVLANVRWISPTYFDAIGMRMIRGRTFTEDETDRGADVVVISEGLARKHFGADDPVGRLFKTGAPSGPTPWREIVGVVEQAHEEWAFNETFYVPFGDRSLDFAELVVHVGARATPGTLRAAIREADPDQAADLLTSLQTLQQADLRSDRTGAMIVVALGIAALALSLLGIFGVVSYGVRQRDREMGIRLALGSRGLGLVSLVLREEARPLALGVAIGAVVGVSVLPLVSGRMSSVGESVQVQLLARGLDLTPAALGAVVASVLAAGALASLVPAWRVLSRDPCRALRSD